MTRAIGQHLQGRLVSDICQYRETGHTDNDLAKAFDKLLTVADEGFEAIHIVAGTPEHEVEARIEPAERRGAKALQEWERVCQKYGLNGGAR